MIRLVTYKLDKEVSSYTTLPGEGEVWFPAAGDLVGPEAFRSMVERLSPLGIKKVDLKADDSVPERVIVALEKKLRAAGVVELNRSRTGPPQELEIEDRTARSFKGALPGGALKLKQPRTP